MKLEQRKNNRIIQSIPIRYKIFHIENLEREIQDQILNLKAEIQDLSLGGIQVVSEVPFKTGEIIELQLEIPGLGMVQTVAKVMWCSIHQESEKTEYCSGVQFIPVYEEDLKKLKEYFRVERPS
jgi:c-di-GMP-binding flagellar brake protein YcgR